MACNLLFQLRNDVSTSVHVSTIFAYNSRFSPKVCLLLWVCFCLKIIVETSKPQRNKTMKMEVIKQLLQEQASSTPGPWHVLARQAALGLCTHSYQMSSFSKYPSLQVHILKPISFDHSHCKSRPTCQQIAALFSKICSLLWLPQHEVWNEWSEET